jgi:hypothetical protein
MSRPSIMKLAAMSGVGEMMSEMILEATFTNTPALRYRYGALTASYNRQSRRCASTRAGRPSPRSRRSRRGRPWAAATRCAIARPRQGVPLEVGIVSLSFAMKRRVHVTTHQWRSKSRQGRGCKWMLSGCSRRAKWLPPFPELRASSAQYAELPCVGAYEGRDTRRAWSHSASS